MNKIVKVNWRDVDIIGKALSVTYSDGSGGFLPVPEYRNHIIDRIAALENPPDKGRPPNPEIQVLNAEGNIIGEFATPEGDLAQFIIRACNCHDELLEVCEAMRDDLDWQGDTTSGLFRKLFAAIAKAKGADNGS